MGLLIDSGIFIHFERLGNGFTEFVRVRRNNEMFLSVISASELLHGVHRAADSSVRARRTAFVEGVISAIPIIGIDLNVARAHAQLWSELAGKGEMIGAHDSWIAATCIAHGLGLLTDNQREFKRVPGLKVESFSRSGR